MNRMHHTFWAEHWARGQIGFHLPQVNPHLVRHIDALAPTPRRVLVPMCGKSVDLAWLAARGHEVLGIEIVEMAARAFFAERDLTPELRAVGSHQALHGAGVTIVVADALAVTPEAVGHFDAIYDRAALVALSPEQRRPYVQALRRLASPDARLLLVSVDHDMPSGPPFSLPPADVATLTSGLFTMTLLDDQDVLPNELRFRERGATRLHEQIHLGRPQP